MKKKILISAYAVSPFKGSEYGAAWNTIINLARHHELWVLYGMSDEHMGDTQTIREYLANNPIPSITFIEVKPGSLASAINLLNKAGLGWFFYFAYYLWQKKAYNEARKIVGTIDIDVVHQLGVIGYREPGYLWKLNKPSVWGPIGGMNIIDPVFLKKLFFLSRLKFTAKNLINYIQLNYSNRIKRAFSANDVLISATRAGQQTILEKFARESYYLSEQGIINNINLDEQKFEKIMQEVKLVWSGNLIERKNLGMCLDVLAATEQKNWMLHILGTGPMLAEMKLKAAKLNLDDNIIWHGHIPRTEATAIMSQSHLHINTSIAEDNPAVIFEALTYGLPTLTIDHCGMGDVICSACGIKIPLGSYEQMMSDMSQALHKVLKDPSVLITLAQSTVDCAGKHNWDRRLSRIDHAYDNAIRQHAWRHQLLQQTLIM